MKRAAPVAGERWKSLKLPARELHELENGLNVHLMRREGLPLVAGRLAIRGGSVFDPAGKLGVGDFACRLLRRGAAGMTADQVSESVDFVGASLGAYAAEENAIVSLSSSTQHFESMLELMVKTLRQPEFPQQELEIARRRSLAALVTEFDDPGALADRALVRATWGAHPYSHEGVSGKKDLNSFTVDDLRKYHRERLGPAIADFFVIGAFDPKTVLAAIHRTLGDWTGGPRSIAPIPEWKGLAKPGQVLIIDKPEQTQAQLRIAGPGVPRGHPDHYTLTVLNAILGGGFTSRLVKEVRVKRGLSYGAGCAFDMLGVAGTFVVSSFTVTDRINQLIDVCLGEIEKMKARGPTAHELAITQRYIAGLYPSRLETNENIAASVADAIHYGFPLERIETYREQIRAVTLKQAKDAAAKYLFGPERCLVLVGNAKQLAPKVEKYGPVTIWKPNELE